MGDEQATDLEPEDLSTDRVGERRQCVGPHPRTFDERGDHGLPRQRCASEHAGMEHGRVQRVRPDQLAPLTIRKSCGGRDQVDCPEDPRSVNRQRRAELGRQARDQLLVSRGRIGKDGLDTLAVCGAHPRDGSRPRAPASGPADRRCGSRPCDDVIVDRSTLERIARNEGLFREVNEAIERGLWPGEQDAAQFRCECAAVECNAVVSAPGARLRADPAASAAVLRA